MSAPRNCTTSTSCAAREIQAHTVLLLHAADVELAIGPDVHRATALGEALDLHVLGVLDELALAEDVAQEHAAHDPPRPKIGRHAEGYEASFLALGGNPPEDFEQVKDILLRLKQGYLLSPPSAR